MKSDQEESLESLFGRTKETKKLQAASYEKKASSRKLQVSGN